MKTWILLLRGINVGGNNLIKMQDLRALLAKAGFQNVRSYIQSGNIALESEISEATQIRQQVQDCIEASHGFTPKTLALDADTLAQIIADNPFPEAVDPPKNLHVFFLAHAPDTPNIEALSALCTASERYVITDHAAYLHLPDGSGNSKLSAQLEKHIGVPATARNWRSVNKILELAAK
ncbi:MAG: hypothetical protein COA69_13890 [Robiginitomaculum sp.]|nr:MAG: hypothetical protein COA69_13890 [Robiginitomaculum sp.]